MPFSADLMQKIKTEAAHLGIRSPSAISVALREQLVDEKSGKMDGRARDYWVCARVVNKGWATPLPGACQVTGLDALGIWADAARAAVLADCDPLPANCAKASVPSARVSLSRNNHAHVVVVLPHSRKAPEVPDAWVDLYVYKSESDAVSKAATLVAGKVF